MSKKKKIIGVSVAVLAVLAAVLIGVFASMDKENVTLQKLLDAGQKYLAELDYETAAAIYSEAIALDHKCVEAYSGLTEAYLGLGDADAAIAVLEEGYQQTGDESLLLQLEELLKLLESGQSVS